MCCCNLCVPTFQSSRNPTSNSVELSRTVEKFLNSKDRKKNTDKEIKKNAYNRDKQVQKMINDHSKMGHDNQAFTNSTVSLRMPQEPRGSYRGSNEFICKSIRTIYHNLTLMAIRFSVFSFKKCVDSISYQRLDFIRIRV